MTPQTPTAPRDDRIMFERAELDRILWLYGMMVAAGEWRDYAIDGLRDRAEFSIFRHSADFPLYRIVKTPGDARRQGAWKVMGGGGAILKRGHELEAVLAVFDRQLKKLAWRTD